MLKAKVIFSILSALSLNFQDVLGAAYTVTVSNTAAHSIPTTLFGQMFEDISWSGDGGLYGELIQNRALQLTTSFAPFTAVGSTLSVATTGGVSAALPNSLAVKVTGNGQGFYNPGYDGINVIPSSSYNASFWVKSSTSATLSLTVSLIDSAGVTLASNVISQGVTTSWTYVDTILKTSSTTPPNTNNKFEILINGAASGTTVYFTLVSLFPEATFKGRTNGMRNDIATVLADMSPKVWRFPGGNNVEGPNLANRWIWNNTIGPLVNRPGREGDWGYINTDGLGLMEYLLWCEDVGMEPIMAVWAGYTLDGASVAEADLGPYVQAAINQIYFVVGDASTNQWAALRAKYGHPEPFTLKWVEIGNEDFFSSTYDYRWTAFAEGIAAVFPDIGLIATSYYDDPDLTPNPGYWDLHYYQTPAWFVENSFLYDSYTRDGTLFFVGEYAVTATNSSCLFGSTSCGRLEYPTMQGASAEAAWMIGIERNSDIIFAASYAPLLGNTNNLAWTPNLVMFNAGTVAQTSSYFVQKLFATYLGDTLLKHTIPTEGASVQWSVSHSSAANAIYIKLTNAGSTSSSIQFNISGYTIGSATLYSVGNGSPTAENTVTAPNALSIVSSSFSASNSFTVTIAAYTVQVLVISTSSSTTTTTTTTTTSSAAGSCQTLYGQCGGIGWTGATCCQSGSTCKVANPYYSQCLAS